LTQSLEFPPEFIWELTQILNSEAISSRYDASGKVVQSSEPFTGNWRLESLDFEPDVDRRRVVVGFNDGDRVVKAVINATDFPDLINGEHNPAFNSTRYSDLAFYVSILLMELILTRDPSSVKADEVRIYSPA
jgi:hypothetical protein